MRWLQIQEWFLCNLPTAGKKPGRPMQPSAVCNPAYSNMKPAKPLQKYLSSHCRDSRMVAKVPTISLPMTRAVTTGTREREGTSEGKQARIWTNITREGWPAPKYLHKVKKAKKKFTFLLITNVVCVYYTFRKYRWVKTKQKIHPCLYHPVISKNIICIFSICFFTYKVPFFLPKLDHLVAVS